LHLTTTVCFRLSCNTSFHAQIDMSRRTLSGGRVLGSTKNASLTSDPSPHFKHSVVSPSASSTSLNSQVSALQFPSEIQDLSSRISLENGETSASIAPVASNTLLACPICCEEMVSITSSSGNLKEGMSVLMGLKVTLLQLNRYCWLFVNSDLAS
jgi:hypothetical protein